MHDLLLIYCAGVVVVFTITSIVAMVGDPQVTRSWRALLLALGQLFLWALVWPYLALYRMIRNP